MSLIVNSGYKSLNLYFTPPANAYYIDDISTSGTQQLQDDSLRTDVDKIYIWIGKTSGFSIDTSSAESAKIGLAYSGTFQNNIIIDKINVSTSSTPSLEYLADNETYYIRYAITSKLDPEQIVAGSDEFIGTTLDISLEIQGWLTRDPIEIETNSDGDLPSPFPNTYTGTFVVYRYSQNITTSNHVQYSILSGSQTGGVAATIVSTNGNSNKGKYTISSITDLVGTVTLRATYTDPLNSARIITIDKILNVSKRRPGASASIVELNSTGIAFVKTANTGEKYPNQVVLSATVTNINAPVYRWYEVGATDTEITFSSSTATESDSPSNYYTRNLSQLNELTVSSSLFNSSSTPSTKTIRVKVTTPSIDPVFEVSDTYTVYYLQEGSDAVALGILNDNQTVSFSGNTSDSTIRNSGTPLTTKLIVVRGTTAIDPSITNSANINSMAANNISSIIFTKSSVAGIDDSAITISPNGDVSIARNTTVFQPDTFLSAEIIFTAAITFVGGAITTLTKGLTINAAFDGQSGSAYWLINNPKLLIKQKDGTLNTTSITWTAKQSVGGTIANYTAGAFKVYKDSTLLTIDTDYTVNNGVVTVSSLDATASYYRVQLFSDIAKTKLVDEDDIQVYEEGTDGIIVFNDNKSHTLTRTSTGEISSYLATGTYFAVQQGSQIFTAKITGATYSWNNINKKLSVTQTLDAGQYYIKSIKFDTSLTVTDFTPTSNWSTKFTVRNSTDLIFEDWSNVQLPPEVLQTTVEFEIEYKTVNGTLGTQLSTQRISVVKDASTIIVDVENDSHQIPFTTDNVGLYLHSGTKIQAFDSNQELQYVNSNSTLNSGQWKIISAVGTGITASAIPERITSPPTKWAEVADHSNLTANTAKIDYTISAKTYRGIEVTGIVAGQTFVKVSNATAIYRIVGTGAIVRFNNNTYSSITATAQKIEGGVSEVFNGWLSYQLKLSNGTLTEETAKTQTSLAISPSSSYNAISILVKLYKLQSDTNPVDISDMPVVAQAEDGNLSPWIVVDSNYLAAPGDRIIANTSQGSFTITLPANPSVGDSVTITDGWDFSQNNVIIGRNGSLIVNELQQGEASDINLDVMNTTYEFIYAGTVRGWDFTSTVGPKGDAGIDARLVKLEYKYTTFTFENDSSLDAATPESIVITATTQNLSGAGAVSFTANAYNASNVLLGNVTLEGTGNTRTLTAQNFNTISGVQDRLSIRYVTITASVVLSNLNQTFSDSVTINRIDNGSDAVVHQMYNESHIVQASTLGTVASYSQAFTLGDVHRGAINETMNWVISKVDDVGLTTQLVQPQKISTTGTISNITPISGGWTATITNLSSVSGLSPTSGTNTIDISAIENNDGRLYGGTPTSVTIQSINASEKSLVYKVLGGTTPVAGIIGGLAKGINKYILTATNLVDNIDGATSTVTATKGSVSLPKVFSLAKSKDGTVFAELDLSNDNINVATKQDGTDGDYTLATTSVSMKVGVINVLPYIDSITITPSSGITFSYTKNGVLEDNLTTTTSIPTSPQINTLSLAVSNLTNDNGKLTVTVSYLSVNYTSEFTISKNKEGPDGQPATVFSLEASSELVYNPNTESFSPESITFTTYRTIGNNVRETYSGSETKIRLEVSQTGSSWTTLGASTDELVTTRTLTTSSIGKTNKYLKYSLFKRGAGNTDGALLDTEVDVIGTDGTNASTIIVDVENDTHQIPFDTEGGTGNYLFSRTIIQAFDNNFLLQYVTNNPPTIAGTWTITSAAGTNITPGSIVVSGKNAQVNDHSAMLAATARISYTIRALSLKGVLVDLLASQTFTRVIRSSIFRIIGVGSITRTNTGSFTSTTVSGQKIEGTAVTNNYGAVSYQLLPGGSVSAKATSPVTISPSANSNYTSVNVKLYSDTSSTEVLDEANIAIIQDGLDATTITVDVINDTHYIPVDSAGANPNMLYSGTDINVYSNTQLMEYISSGETLTDNKWKITSITGDNITPAGTIPAAASGKAYATIPDHTGMSSSETGKVTYTIQAKATGKAITSGILAAQTFTKVRRTAIYRITNAQTIVVNPNTSTITQATINAQKIDGSTVTNNFGYITLTNDSGSEGNRQQVTASGITTAAVATTKKVVAKLYESSSGGSAVDTAEILVVSDGANGLPGLPGINGTGSIFINYSNDVHLVPITGGTVWTGSGGTITVYQNGQLLVYKAYSNDFPGDYVNNRGTYNLYISRVSGNSLTIGSISGELTNVATLADWAGTINTVTVYRITAYVRATNNTTTTISTDVTLTPTSDPRIFRLVPTPGIVAKSTNPIIYTPNNITYRLYISEGKNAPSLSTSGVAKLTIAYATDTAGSVFSVSNDYNSSISSLGTSGGYAWAIPTTVNITAVKASVYDASNNLLDEEITPISQTAQGLPGVSVPAVFLSPLSINFIKTGASSFSPANPTITATNNFSAQKYRWSIAGYGTLGDINSTSSTNTVSATGLGPISVIVEGFKNSSDTLPTATSQVFFAVVENGKEGDTGRRVASGYVYYLTAQNGQPSNPPDTASYNFSNAKIEGLGNSGWSINAPKFEAGTQPKTYWAASYTAIETGPNTNTGVPTFTVQQALGFTGIVTFSSYTKTQDGQTVIDGAKIATGSISVDSIKTGTATIVNNNTFSLGAGTNVYLNDNPNNAIPAVGVFETQNPDTVAIVAIARNATNYASVAYAGSSAYAGYNGIRGMSNNVNGQFRNVFQTNLETDAITASHSWGYDGNNLRQVKTGFSAANGSNAVYTYYMPWKPNSADMGAITNANLSEASFAGTFTYLSGTAQNNRNQAQTLICGVTDKLVGFSTNFFWPESDQSKTTAAIANEDRAGIFRYSHSNGAIATEIQLATSAHAAYLSAGGVGPFTGSHDALLDYSELFELGDIIVDVEVIVKKGISDTITKVSLSSLPNQKAVVGVISEDLDLTDHIPTTLGYFHTDTLNRKQMYPDTNPTSNSTFIEKNVETKVTNFKINPAYEEILQNHRLISFNALGEGQINVCGEGGNIEIGDFITTSSIRGKGMKQADNIFHTYTVAKSRESVTFSSPTEIKTIACIYHCG